MDLLGGNVRAKNIYHTYGKYKMFGINAELLIDHAWGRESCTMKDIKAYKPKTNSISKNLMYEISKYINLPSFSS